MITLIRYRDNSVTQKAVAAATGLNLIAFVLVLMVGILHVFVAAKVSPLANLPQGEAERKQRVQNMVAAMDAEQFGSCTNHGECEAVCPMEISTKFITKMNREHLSSVLTGT